jgi:hypothetical protein
MSDLSDESRELLSAAPLDEARPEELEVARLRVYSALGIAAPPPVPVPVGGSGPAPAAPLAAGTSAAIKGMVGAALVLAAVGGVVALRHSPPPKAAVTASAPLVAPPAPRELAPPAPVVLPSAPPEVRTEPEAPRSRGRIEAPVPSASAAAKAQEGALLVAAAEAQLRAGQPAAALSLYERYLREHPSGLLRQESEAGRILSLCAMGQRGSGQAELARFEARYASSPSLPRLRRACGSEP